ncbi:MAG: hypothetical protein AAF638_12345 [Pseudomonadota bacterium]
MSQAPKSGHDRTLYDSGVHRCSQEHADPRTAEQAIDPDFWPGLD